MQRRTLIGGLAALPAWSLAQPSGGTDTFPSKPIRLLLPFPAGGATDNIARLLADMLRADLQQPVLVENRPGANYMVAARALLGSPADGYTVLLTTNGQLSIAPALYRTQPFDTVNGVTHLGSVDAYPYVVVTRGENPLRTMQAFIDHARTGKHKVSYVTVGNVTSVAGAMLNNMGQVDMLEVRYKGNAEAMSDLVAGRVDFAMIAPSVVMPFIKVGKLVAVAVTTEQRFPQLPDVPTVRESVKGLEGFSIGVWNAMLAPPDLPPAVAARLASALRGVVGSTRFKAEMERYGEFTMPGTPEEVKARIQAEIPKWKQAIVAAKMPLLD